METRKKQSAFPPKFPAENKGDILGWLWITCSSKIVVLNRQFPVLLLTQSGGGSKNVISCHCPMTSRNSVCHLVLMAGAAD